MERSFKVETFCSPCCGSVCAEGEQRWQEVCIEVAEPVLVLNNWLSCER